MRKASQNEAWSFVLIRGCSLKQYSDVGGNSSDDGNGKITGLIRARSQPFEDTHMSLTSNHFMPHRDAPEPYIEPKPVVFIHERPQGVLRDGLPYGIESDGDPRCPLFAWLVTCIAGWALLTAYWWVPVVVTWGRR